MVTDQCDTCIIHMSGKRWVYDQNFYKGYRAVDRERVAVRDA